MADKKTILLADDEFEIRESLKKALVKKDYDVIEVSNGNEAYEMITSNNSIQLVISDVRMPNGSGDEFLLKLRANGYASLPVILITGYSETPPEQLIKKGANFVLTKPFSRNLLFEKINEFLGDVHGTSKAN